jgi:type I restriction enzyme R subunit
MTLAESIVEEAVLERFGQLGYTVENWAKLTRGEAATERDSFGDGVLVGRLGAGIRRLNPTFSSSRTLPSLRDTLLPNLLSGEVSVASLNAKD